MDFDETGLHGAPFSFIRVRGENESGWSPSMRGLSLTSRGFYVLPAALPYFRTFQLLEMLGEERTVANGSRRAGQYFESIA